MRVSESVNRDPSPSSNDGLRHFSCVPDRKSKWKTLNMTATLQFHPRIFRHPPTGVNGSYSAIGSIPRSYQRHKFVPSCQPNLRRVVDIHTFGSHSWPTCDCWRRQSTALDLAFSTFGWRAVLRRRRCCNTSNTQSVSFLDGANSADSRGRLGGQVVFLTSLNPRTR